MQTGTFLTVLLLCLLSSVFCLIHSNQLSDDRNLRGGILSVIRTLVSWSWRHTATALECNQGFGGSNCTLETYRSSKVLILDGSNHIDLVPKMFGGSSSDRLHNKPVLKWDAWIRLDAKPSTGKFSEIFSWSNGDDDKISLSVSSSLSVTFQTSCGSKMAGKIATGRNALKLGSWSILTVIMTGTATSSCNNNMNATLYIDNRLAAHVTNMSQVSRLTRTSHVLGRNFVGKFSMFRSWDYNSDTDMIGQCPSLPRDNGYMPPTHFCDFSDLKTELCGTVAGTRKLVEDSKNFLGRFQYSMYVWSTTGPVGSRTWVFPIYQKTSRDLLIQSLVQRGVKVIFDNLNKGYCISGSKIEKNRFILA